MNRFVVRCQLIAEWFKGWRNRLARLVGTKRSRAVDARFARGQCMFDYSDGTACRNRAAAGTALCDEHQWEIDDGDEYDPDEGAWSR